MISAKSIIELLEKEKFVVYFLLLWAVSFVLWGIYDIVDFGPLNAQGIMWFLGALCELGAGAILGLFSLKLFSALGESYPPPPPPA